MPSSDVVVRPPAAGPELAAYLELVAAQFMRDAPPDIRVADLDRYLGEAPAGIMPRCAFAGAEMVGGYLIERRLLRVGAARIPTGCVGTVVVRPDRRGGGVGRVLMLDALAFGRDSGMALLLLNGLAGYYRPFGFADVFDATEHAVRPAEVLALSPGPYRVREATVDDAPAMRGLYDRHCGPHPGSFERDPGQEAFLVRLGTSMAERGYRERDNLPFSSPLVAVDAEGQVRGSLCPPWGPLRAFGDEVAADDWPAVSALLRHKAEALSSLGEPAALLSWPLPPDSLASELLGDHLTVERRTTVRPWANWEAAVVSPSRLLAAMVPTWDARWRASRTAWQGTVAIVVEGSTLALRLDSAGVAPVDASQATHRLELTSRVVAPLLFGFRSVAWARQQEDQQVPAGLVPVLETLFPPQTPWVAPTDGC